MTQAHPLVNFLAFLHFEFCICISLNSFPGAQPEQCSGPQKGPCPGGPAAKVSWSPEPGSWLCNMWKYSKASKQRYRATSSWDQHEAWLVPKSAAPPPFTHCGPCMGASRVVALAMETPSLEAPKLKVMPNPPMSFGVNLLFLLLLEP